LAKAIRPHVERHRYATQLGALTHEHGTYARQFHGNDEMPAVAAQTVIAEPAGEVAVVELSSAATPIRGSWPDDGPFALQRTGRPRH
jgi:hypothetical protein